MKILRRIAVLAVLSLVAGLSINAFVPDGIPWRLLVPSLGRPSRFDRIVIINADIAADAAAREPVLFLDVRPAVDFRIDRIPGAKSAPFQAFFRHPSKYLPDHREALIIVYDFESGSKKARLVAQWIARQGFHRVRMLHTGFSEWIESGKPVERGEGR